MYISHFNNLGRLKSYWLTQSSDLELGFNFVVGRNNAGKTALLQALSLQGLDERHRSLLSVPHQGMSPSAPSELDITYRFDRREVVQALFRSNIQRAAFQTGGGSVQDVVARGSELAAIFNELEVVDLTATFRDQHLQHLTYFGGIQNLDSGSTTGMRYEVTSGILVANDIESLNMEWSKTLPGLLFEIARQRVHYFQAERPKVGDSDLSDSSTLAQDGTNLAALLHKLYNETPRAFDRYKRAVMDVFPEILDITAPSFSGNRANVYLWEIEPESERNDLAQSLSI